MAYYLSAEENGFVISLFSVVKSEEIRRVHTYITSLKSFPRCEYQIWDFSKVEKLYLSNDDIRNLAEQHSTLRSHNAHHRIAIIPRKDVRVRLDRIFHIIERAWGAYESRSFATVDAARVWAMERPEPPQVHAQLSPNQIPNDGEEENPMGNCKGSDPDHSPHLP